MENSLIDISIDETAPQVESPECVKLRERIAASRRLEDERHSILEVCPHHMSAFRVVLLGADPL